MLLCVASPLAAQDLVLSSRIVLNERNAAFGGLSGIEVAPDGLSARVVSDRGTLFDLDILRDEGLLSGIRLTGERALFCADVTPCPGGRRDTETLALSDTGTLLVSFEDMHRVARLDATTGETRDLPTPPDFADFPKNSGIEALAVTPQGAPLAIPERSGASDRPFPLFRFDGAAWDIIADLPRHRPFLPTGADMGPDGRLYLLERAVTPLGFRSRIRSFDLSAQDLDEIIHWTTSPGIFDNLEGISLWQDRTGRTRLLLISDDNFLRIQRTELVELILR
ncbi:MAG: esterase-like activity of phytase family protein [Sulfitobacter sp.]|nr:esterase-like activity of phytase family protein [Sulfitobacter sp.]